MLPTHCAILPIGGSKDPYGDLASDSIDISQDARALPNLMQYPGEHPASVCWAAGQAIDGKDLPLRSASI